jgi:hypothetical protein
MDTTMDRSVLEGKLIPELQQIAQSMGIEGAQKLRPGVGQRRGSDGPIR